MTDIAGERDVVIQAPPGQVFEYISDFSHHADWNHQILEVTQISDGPVDVGTRFRAREQTPKTVPIPMKLMFPVMLRFFGIERHTEAELTELEPGRKLAWKASASRRNGEYWMRAEWELELAGEGEGGTRVTQRFRFLPEHPRARSMMADAERNAAVIGKEVSANLEQLKQTLESGSATAS